MRHRLYQLAVVVSPILCLAAFVLTASIRMDAETPAPHPDRAAGPVEASDHSSPATQFFGPMQYNPFHGTNRDNVYIVATRSAEHSAESPTTQ